MPTPKLAVVVAAEAAVVETKVAVVVPVTVVLAVIRVGPAVVAAEAPAVMPVTAVVAKVAMAAATARAASAVAVMPVTAVVAKVATAAEAPAVMPVTAVAATPVYGRAMRQAALAASSAGGAIAKGYQAQRFVSIARVMMVRQERLVPQVQLVPRVVMVRQVQWAQAAASGRYQGGSDGGGYVVAGQIVAQGCGAGGVCGGVYHGAPRGMVAMQAGHAHSGWSNAKHNKHSGKHYK